MAHSGLRAMLAATSLFLTLGLLQRVVAFDNTKNDNLAVYWGQDSEGNQQRLSFYCQDDTIDVFPLAFLYIFRGKGGEPVIDFGNTCSQWDNPVFPGTALANCSFLAADIKTCQAAGKLVTLSLGGGTGQVGFSSDSQAESFADQIWNLFLGGESDIRPFGDAVLDGIDLDIESGKPAHYAAFVNRIRSTAGITNLTATTFASARANAATALKEESTIDVLAKEKYYYFTAAPQCPYPDAYIGAALNEAPFDAVYVQFYNNYCGLDQPSDYNFDTWDTWAKTKSGNPDVKVYIGAPGSEDAAGQGYVNVSTLASYVADAQEKYSSFGGVMLWDADTAHSNSRFDLGIKTAMVTSGEKFAPRKQSSTANSKAKQTEATATNSDPVASRETAAPASEEGSDERDTARRRIAMGPTRWGSSSQASESTAPDSGLKRYIHLW